VAKTGWHKTPKGLRPVAECRPARTRRANTSLAALVSAAALGVVLGYPAISAAALTASNVTVTLSGYVDTSCTSTGSPPCYAYDMSILNKSDVAIDAMTVDLPSGAPITSFTMNGQPPSAATGVGDAFGIFNMNIAVNATDTGTLLTQAPLTSTDVVELYFSPDNFATSIQVDVSVKPSASEGQPTRQELDEALSRTKSALGEEDQASKDVGSAIKLGRRTSQGRDKLDAASAMLADAEDNLKAAGALLPRATVGGNTPADVTDAKDEISAAMSADHYARDSIPAHGDLANVLSDLARAERDKKAALANLREALRQLPG
jgi:hypothetical protein